MERSEQGPAGRTRARILQVFERRFLPAAARPGAAETVEAEMPGKLESVARRGDRASQQLLHVVASIRELWGRRRELAPKDVLYLAGALLYVLSPLDAMPDLLPGVGYADDLVVAVAVLGLVREAIGRVRDETVERLSESVVERSKEAAVEVLDRAGAAAVQRSVAAVAIGLWGMTTAAALSLAVAAATGGQSAAWTTYLLAGAGIALAWNLAAAVPFVRALRRLDGPLRERLVLMVLSKLGVRELLVLLAPLVVLFALGVARVLST